MRELHATICLDKNMTFRGVPSTMEEGASAEKRGKEVSCPKSPRASGIYAFAAKFPAFFVAICCLAPASHALADGSKSFDIQEQSIASALNEFARQSDRQI